MSLQPEISLAAREWLLRWLEGYLAEHGAGELEPKTDVVQAARIYGQFAGGQLSGRQSNLTPRPGQALTTVVLGGQRYAVGDTKKQYTRPFEAPQNSVVVSKLPYQPLDPIWVPHTWASLPAFGGKLYPAWAVTDHELSFYNEASLPFPIFSYVELYDYAREVLANMQVDTQGRVQIIDPAQPFDLTASVPTAIPYGTVWVYRRNDVMPQVVYPQQSYWETIGYVSGAPFPLGDALFVEAGFTHVNLSGTVAAPGLLAYTAAGVVSELTPAGPEENWTAKTVAATFEQDWDVVTYSRRAVSSRKLSGDLFHRSRPALAPELYSSAEKQKPAAFFETPLADGYIIDGWFASDLYGVAINSSSTARHEPVIPEPAARVLYLPGDSVLAQYLASDGVRFVAVKITGLTGHMSETPRQSGQYAGYPVFGHIAYTFEPELPDFVQGYNLVGTDQYGIPGYYAKGQEYENPRPTVFTDYFCGYHVGDKYDENGFVIYDENGHRVVEEYPLYATRSARRYRVTETYEVSANPSWALGHSFSPGDYRAQLRAGANIGVYRQLFVEEAGVTQDGDLYYEPGQHGYKAFTVVQPVGGFGFTDPVLSRRYRGLSHSFPGSQGVGGTTFARAPLQTLELSQDNYSTVSWDAGGLTGRSYYTSDGPLVRTQTATELGIVPAGDDRAAWAAFYAALMPDFYNAYGNAVIKHPLAGVNEQHYYGLTWQAEFFDVGRMDVATDYDTYNYLSYAVVVYLAPSGYRVQVCVDSDPERTWDVNLWAFFPLADGTLTALSGRVWPTDYPTPLMLSYAMLHAKYEVMYRDALRLGPFVVRPRSAQDKLGQLYTAEAAPLPVTLYFEGFDDDASYPG